MFNIMESEFIDIRLFDGLFNDSDFKEIYKILNINEVQFSEAKIYDAKLGQNIIDKSIRDADRISYKDSELFSWLQARLLPILNKNIKNHNFVLLNNNIDLIKYTKNKFFKK